MSKSKRILSVLAVLCLVCCLFSGALYVSAMKADATECENDAAPSTALGLSTDFWGGSRFTVTDLPDNGGIHYNWTDGTYEVRSGLTKAFALDGLHMRFANYASTEGAKVFNFYLCSLGTATDYQFNPTAGRLCFALKEDGTVLLFTAGHAGGDKLTEGNAKLAYAALSAAPWDIKFEKNADGSMKPGSEYMTNDATVAAGCKYLQGSRIPDIYGSISSSLKFRGFALGLLFTYSLGGKIYDSIYNALMEPSFVGQTYHRNALRTWTAPGQRTDVPRTTTTASTQITDRYLVDASYFAVKNISLGYSLPKGVLGKVGIESLRVYLSADSPWIFTHLKGMNPQASFTGSTSYSYTPNRTFTLGVDLKF